MPDSTEVFQDSTRAMPKQGRAVQTYERLLDVSGDLLAEVGIERISTNLICARAGMTPPALYRYFKDKYAVLEALGRRLLSRRSDILTLWLAETAPKGQLALADGLPWTLLDSADYVSVGKNATVTFGASNQIKNSAQFFLSAPASFEVPKMPETSMERGATEIRALLYPNPVPLGGRLRVETDWKGIATFRLFDAKGNQVLVQQFEAVCSIDRLEMPAGVYYYRIENEMHMETGAVIFE